VVVVAAVTPRQQIQTGGVAVLVAALQITGLRLVLLEPELQGKEITAALALACLSIIVTAVVAAQVRLAQMEQAQRAAMVVTEQPTACRDQASPMPVAVVAALQLLVLWALVVLAVVVMQEHPVAARVTRELQI